MKMIPLLPVRFGKLSEAQIRELDAIPRPVEEIRLFDADQFLPRQERLYHALGKLDACVEIESLRKKTLTPGSPADKATGDYLNRIRPQAEADLAENLSHCPSFIAAPFYDSLKDPKTAFQPDSDSPVFQALKQSLARPCEPNTTIVGGIPRDVLLKKEGGNAYDQVMAYKYPNTYTKDADGSFRWH